MFKVKSCQECGAAYTEHARDCSNYGQLPPAMETEKLSHHVFEDDSIWDEFDNSDFDDDGPITEKIIRRNWE